MASVNDRLQRLEARVRPTLLPTPSLDLTLKLMDHRRRCLDHEDRAHDGRDRLEAGAEPPEPLELSLDEKRLMLESSRHFIGYLAEQRAKNPGVDAEGIDRAERHTRDKIALLEAEIDALEMEGDES